MAFGQPSRRLLAVGAVVALAATACGGGGGGGGGGTATSGTGPKDGTPGKKGGTVYLLEQADFEHLDPARNYVSNSLDFVRLLYRTLTTYKAVPGNNGNTVVGDLATDTGTPSDGGKTWKFTLKSGLKYEDGSPITTQDIKYGIERAFDPDLPEGPQYIQQFLAGVPANYKGPKKSGTELGTQSIETPDSKTIIFHLNKAVGDFSYTAAEPTFAPVPKSKDTGVKYDERVFSSGPYKIQVYNRGKNMILVRNTNWSSATDTVRGAYPDSFSVTFGLDPNVIDQKLIASSGTDAQAIMLDSTVQPANLSAVLNNPAVKSRMTTGLNGFTRYVAINTRKQPDLKVRQALMYAINRETVRAALGGTTAGEYASTLSVPSIPGHQDLSSLYPAPPTGDPGKAKELLAQAGKSNLTLTYACPNTPAPIRVATAIQEAFKRAGITLNIQQLPAAKYYTIIGDPTKEPDLAYAGWGADWPSMSTDIPPLFDGRQIKPQGNQNFALLNNPTFNSEMDRISAITDVNQQAKEWGNLEKKIMEQAPIIPLLYLAGVLLRGTKVGGAYLHAYYGQYDVVSLSVT